MSNNGLASDQDGHDLLRVKDLQVHFPVKIPLVQQLFSRERQVVHAVDGVTFSLKPGEILGLVGESGCGKTTVGRAIVRLVKPTSGRIIFEGVDITRMGQGRLRPLRRSMQIIFQDPHASLNPAMTIGHAIGHPLRIHHIEHDEEAIQRRVLDAMREVGLTPSEQIYDKYPSDLSGGQKQRAVIARATILDPKLLVVDEGVAMLDMSVRAKVLELMLHLKRKHGLTYIFITHDLATAKFLCDRIAIMYLGRIVEIGPAASIYSDPKHPYTQALIQVIPIPDPDKRRKKILPRGEVPDAIHPPIGCRFHPRCQSVLPTCGWEGRDFIDLLDRHLSQISKDSDEDKILGPIEEWTASGLTARRKASPENFPSLVDKAERVISRGPSAMVQALESVTRKGEWLIVQFRNPNVLRQTLISDRTVECLLYQ
jgi:oligopeptide/dipeptide ABC transporter ATP-binding protein